MSIKIFTENESEVRGYCRDYPVVFKTARNAEIFDKDGQRYIDFLGGAGTLNYGHNNPRIKQRVIEHLEQDAVLHGLDFHTEAKAEFVDTFVNRLLAPRGLDYKLQFTGPTGTNAVEAALKLARKITGRQNIFAFTGGFHGMTLGALACTANNHHRGGAGAPLGGVTRVPFQDYLGEDGDTIAYIRRLIEDPSSGIDLPAAMIIETVQGEGGVNVAGYEWLRRLQQICRDHDILLIVDDIQIGCGRSSTFFSFEGMDIEPDIVCLSKSLSGIGLPMAVVMMKPELDQWEPGEHNGTFRGNNLAFVGATAAIDQYWQDEVFTKSIRAKSRRLREGFTRIRDLHPAFQMGVRGRGLMYGLHMPVDGMAAACVGEAFKRNLIIENCGPKGSVLKFLGPMTIPNQVLDDGLARLEEAVNAVAQQMDPA